MHVHVYLCFHYCTTYPEPCNSLAPSGKTTNAQWMCVGRSLGSVPGSRMWRQFSTECLAGEAD